MGNKASKPAQSAARKFPTRAPGSAVPPTPPPRAAPRAAPGAGPAAGPASGATGRKASFAKDDHIQADGRDPDLDPNPLRDAAFSSRLRQMGVATPNPTLSNSSTANPFPSGTAPPASASSTTSSTYQQQQDPRFRRPAPGNATLGVLEARRLLQERAEAELEDSATGARGREFLDAATLRHVLGLRARGTPASEIEARLRLKPGVVARLGTQGVVVPLVV